MPPSAAGTRRHNDLDVAVRFPLSADSAPRTPGLVMPSEPRYTSESAEHPGDAQCRITNTQ